MAAYYNEIEPFAAAWLRELMKAGLIADGTVDERPIEQVEASDLKGFCQCHWFAGIGVWSYALRAAGWPDDSPVWTGSCPCQSFSASGKRGGFSDKRHLWPAWFRLISECKPHTIFGEQVGGQGGKAWFDTVSADLEGIGYAVGAAITGACGFGAPHIRKRLYFVADTESQRREQFADSARESAGVFDAAAESPQRLQPASRHSASLSAGDLVDAAQYGRGEGRPQPARQQGRSDAAQPSGDDILGDAAEPRLQGDESAFREGRDWHMPTEPGYVNGFWANCEWLRCHDGKFRPTQPGLFPLATGAAKRVGRLRGYGNCIVAPQAQGFIEAFLEISPN